MAKVSPLLRWLVVAAIVLAVPWTAALVGAYIVWKTGAIGRARCALSAAMKRLRVSDAIFMLRMRGGVGLEEHGVDCRYYAASGLAPFIATQSGAGCRLLSAIRVSDSSCSQEKCRLAVEEALRYLTAASAEVCLSLRYIGTGAGAGRGGAIGTGGLCAMESTIVFAVDCGGDGALQIDIRARGIEATERVATACRMIDGLAPTLRAEALRGKEIAEAVAAGEMVRP